MATINRWHGRKFSQYIEMSLRDNFGDEWFVNHPPANFMILQQYAQKLRTTCSEFEYQIANLLRERGLPIEHQVIYFNRYIADLALPSARTIIEIDGGYHQLPHQVLNDKDRDAVFHSFGFTVHRWPQSMPQLELERKIECFVKAYHANHKSHFRLKPLTRPGAIEKITTNGLIQKALDLKKRVRSH